MDRIDMLAEKIDYALRDDASGNAVFDMLPAWEAEYLHVHGTTPGTSGGSFALDHFMRESGMEQGNFDEDYSDGQGNGLARLGRCVYRWNDSGFYIGSLYPTTAEAQQVVAEDAPSYDTGEEG